MADSLRICTVPFCSKRIPHQTCFPFCYQHYDQWRQRVNELWAARNMVLAKAKRIAQRELQQQQPA